ncbi:biotin transporter BioY [Comamonas sp. NLF-1-9]|uniref:biotin transporter BioY n=1 Tax=Comamonas sp. NLF-1-9 TaxID=2853163 RepID=UPI001C43F8A0|nr:biotin transporter BioY [Comamonas sp. NLF-1-9]QXL83118.1 biotin transporter BioY [Comamonas sp. NLF-1-9]
MPETLSRERSHAMVQVALFAALTAVLGLIPKLDLPFGVPITLQSLGPMLAGCFLGARRGFQAMLLFELAVAAGLPLLAGGRGGLGAFAAPTSGYLVGFMLAAAATGLLMGRLPRATPLHAAISAFVASAVGGVLLLHASGILGLMQFAALPLQKALLLDLAFVPGDLLKCAVCAIVVHAVAKAMPDWPLGGGRR